MQGPAPPLPPRTSPPSRLAKVVLVLVAVLLTLLVVLAASSPLRPGPKATAIGVAFSPANLPNPSPAEVDAFFTHARAIGSHVALIVEWAAMPSRSDIGEVQRRAREAGLAFHLYLSPIALYGGRQEPAIPASVDGTGFGDASVRSAFVAEALALSAMGPDVLGLGTEVNLLAQNPAEFAAYVSLAAEAYGAVKAGRPAQDVTISFQWDVLLTQGQFDVLPLFAGSLDVYSFTTYPSFFGNPEAIPPNYYASVRELLPTERLGFSEVGWPSTGEGGETAQAAFHVRLPALMEGARPEHVTLALLHDVDAFTGELATLNSAGIRHRDGRPKPSWDVVLGLPGLP